MSVTPELVDAAAEPQGRIARYSRDHPHLFRHLALDIAISLLLGVGIFQFYENARQEALSSKVQISGAVTLSASELVSEVKRVHGTAYWLGPISGSRYGLVISKSGVAIITYYSGGLGLDNYQESRLIIKSSSRPNSLHPLQDVENQFNNIQDSTNAGLIYAYDKSFRDHVEITLPKKSGSVLIFYPSIRSPANIQLDVESLILIS